MRNIIALISCTFLLVVSRPVKADELTDLKDQLNKIQQKITQLEDNQTRQSNLKEQEKDSISDVLKWAEKIKLSGDFRYRHDSIDDDTSTVTRDRDRIRARLKIQAEVNDEWDAIFRIGSGSSDSPISTNQTLGDPASDSFSSKMLWLDWAYADYHPASFSGLNVLFGKMSNPFYAVGKHQLIFDSDLSPEGGALTYQWKFSDNTTAQLAGGAYWIRERSTDADTGLFGIQGLLKHQISHDMYVLGGAGYYDFGNIQGKTLSGISASGNTVTPSGAYVYDYDIFEIFGEFGLEIRRIPVAVFSSYIKNTSAIKSADTAWTIGAKINKAKDPGSWEVVYDYRDVQTDAVVGGLCDSDFIGGGSDGRGHVFGVNYQLAKSVQFSLKYYMSEKNVSTTQDDYNLLQADIVLKF